MRQQRNGVEDSVPGMYSGEMVTQIVNAETAAGFVLAFSSGRMAYMSVRDSHGKPQISVQFLRTSLGPSSSGIFGSIRHALLPAGSQGDIAAVRSDRSSRQGERMIVAATSRGRLHAWRIHRGGHHDVLAEMDARETIVDAIRERDLSATKFPVDSFKILDFAYVPKDVDPRYFDMNQLFQEPPSDDVQHLLLLTSFTTEDTCRYTLVEVLLPSEASHRRFTVGAVRPITSYSTVHDVQSIAKPRVHLPRPAMIAFVVFARAIIIASIARIPDSPDSQLLEDSKIVPTSYEDVVDLKDDSVMEIVGSGIEEPLGQGSEESRAHRVKVKNPSVVVSVRGAGTLRIATTDVDRFSSEKPPAITAKSKLEQAVFFGIKMNNPLVFDVPRELPFSDKEWGDAALELSSTILNSNSPHLAVLAPHLENNMRMRVQALDKMMLHLQSLHINLGRVTRWKLLWNAEKLQAARYVWQKHEQFLNDRPADSKKDLVAEIVEYIRAEEKSQPDNAKGEVDVLRHWFVHDTFRMNIFIAWAYEVIKYNSKANLEKAALTRLIYEATEINNGALRDAMNYRKEHLSLYGLQGEKMANGILSDDYEGLPPPWTSDRYISNNLKRLVELASEWANQQYLSGSEKDPDRALVQQIRSLLPPLTEVYLTALQELYRWARATDDTKMFAMGQTFRETYEKDRHDKVVLLAQSENWHAAVRIAEEHGSLHALAEILTKELNFHREKLETGGITPEEATLLEETVQTKADQIQGYFEKYGKAFAFPFYEFLLGFSGIDAVLGYEGDKDFKTAFLRQKPELAKISWINDVVGEEDIVHAAETLLNLGLSREQQLWSKKIELSLGKLARMAEASRPASKASLGVSVQEATVNSTAVDASVDAIDKELAIIRIQDQLDRQIRPLVTAALDESEELPLALEAFPIKVPKKHKIIHDIYEAGLGRLLKHEALDPLTLIDLLTLIQLQPEYRELIPDQFFLAVEVAYYGLSGDQRDQAERLIWRRCYLGEDWTKINNTSLKGDADIMEVLGGTNLFGVCCAEYANRESSIPRPLVSGGSR